MHETTVLLDKDENKDENRDKAATATTVVDRRPDGTPDTTERRRALGGVTRGEVLNILGAGATGFCTALLLFGRLAPLSGPLGFVVVGYLVSLGAYALLAWLEDDGPAVRDRLMTVVLWSAAALLFSGLVLVVGFTFLRGREALVRSTSTRRTCSW